MGALDPQGIFKYDDSEAWSPQDDYQNLLANSVSNTIADVRAEIADLELLADSGWVAVTTFGSGITATSGHPPRVRKVGDRVDLAGAVNVTTAGSMADLLTVPAGYIPAGTYLNTFVGSGVTDKGKAFTLYTDSVNPGRILIPTSYITAALVRPEVIPLIASWYIT